MRADAITNPNEHWLSILTGSVLPGIAAFSIAFPIRFNSIVAVSTLVVCGILFWRAKGIWRPMLRSWPFIFVAIHFVVLVIGLSYTPNLKAGLAIVERYSFALLCLALVYMMSAFGATLSSVVRGFAIGVAVVILFGFGYTLFGVDAAARNQILQTGHTEFTDLIRIHPTYIGMYLMFLFFFVLEYFRMNHSELSTLRKVSVFAALIIIMLLVVFLRSQINLMIFPPLALIYGIVIMRKRAALVTFLLFTAGFVVFLIDAHRVTTFLDRYGRNVSTALENRMQIWEASIDAFRSAPLFGAGTGGAQVNLNQEYSQLGYVEGIEKSYNTHNQYLQFLVRNGLMEFLTFMALLVYGFYRSLRLTNYSFLFFLMLVAFIMMAESCLSVQKGIFFFYFFYAAFVFLPESRHAAATPAPEKGNYS